MPFAYAKLTNMGKCCYFPSDIFFLICKVTGFGATLQLFFTYGLSSRSSLLPTAINLNGKGVNSENQKPLLESRKSNAYVPPHLRRRERSSKNYSDARGSVDCNRTQYGLSSSDSELSDSDGYAMNGDWDRSSKARVAAIVCIQVISYTFLPNHCNLYIIIHLRVWCVYNQMTGACHWLNDLASPFQVSE